MSAEQRLDAAVAAAKHLSMHPIFKRATHIACYYAFQSELDTQPLIEAIWRANKICYLPVLLEERTLGFARYDEGDVLEANSLSILEPSDNTRRIALELLELIIPPLVAFDAEGHRLGTGGGYYDRTFAYLFDRKTAQPSIIGYGFALQQAPTLPADVWDIRLSGFATEQGVTII